jgi:CheY-like chemotaxis protein
VTELDPDLILLDIMLPDGDGFSVCRRLQANPDTRRIPVIFLTAKGDRDAVVRGFESGGIDYIVKPFDVEVLLARVQTQTTLSRLSRKLQQTLDERTQRLRQANHRLQELSLELARIEERQRRKLAEELHDTTIQQLVLARLLIESGQGRGGEGGSHRAQLIREPSPWRRAGVCRSAIRAGEGLLRDGPGLVASPGLTRPVLSSQAHGANHSHHAQRLGWSGAERHLLSIANGRRSSVGDHR